MSGEAEDMLWYLTDHFLPVSVWQVFLQTAWPEPVKKELKLDSFIRSFYQIILGVYHIFPIVFRTERRNNE